MTPVGGLILSLLVMLAGVTYLAIFFIRQHERFMDPKSDPPAWPPLRSAVVTIPGLDRWNPPREVRDFHPRSPAPAIDAAGVRRAVEFLSNVDHVPLSPSRAIPGVTGEQEACHAASDAKPLARREQQRDFDSDARLWRLQRGESVVEMFAWHGPGLTYLAVYVDGRLAWREGCKEGAEPELMLIADRERAVLEWQDYVEDDDHDDDDGQAVDPVHVTH